MKRNPTCEPCGDCPWCAQRWHWRDQARARGAALRAALKLLADLAGCIEDECRSAGPYEVAEHPTLREHSRAAGQARRFIAKHAPPDRRKP